MKQKGVSDIRKNVPMRVAQQQQERSSKKVMKFPLMVIYKSRIHTQG